MQVVPAQKMSLQRRQGAVLFVWKSETSNGQRRICCNKIDSGGRNFWQTDCFLLWNDVTICSFAMDHFLFGEDLYRSTVTKMRLASRHLYEMRMRELWNDSLVVRIRVSMYDNVESLMTFMKPKSKSLTRTLTRSLSHSQCQSIGHVVRESYWSHLLIHRLLPTPMNCPLTYVRHRYWYRYWYWYVPGKIVSLTTSFDSFL